MLDTLQERLGARFKDIGLLRRALTHRSAAAENPRRSNERLEFLGDAVIGLVIGEELFRRFPDHSEGDLAKSKAYAVSEPALAEAALAIGLEEFVVMSGGEAAAGGRRRRSILADAFEAVVAAVYLDAGIRKARSLVRKALTPALRLAMEEEHRRDFKSALQERTQAELREAPLYRIIAEEGREHQKTFIAQVVVVGKSIGEGTGGSKKEAEQAAARDALARFSEFFPNPPPPNRDATPESGVQ